MRRIIITLAPLALLAGCGQSEEDVLKHLRTTMAEQCAGEMRNGGAAQARQQGMDPDRFCSCLVEKSLAGKSVADLQKMGEAGSAEAGSRAGIACRAEQLGAAAAPATAAPAAAAAAAPAGEQGAADTGAEAMEEAADEAE